MFDQLMKMRCTIKKVGPNGFGDRGVISTSTNIPCFYEPGIFDVTKLDGQVVQMQGCLYLKPDAPIENNYTNYDIEITYPTTINNLQVYQINMNHDPNSAKLHHYEVWMK